MGKYVFGQQILFRMKQMNQMFGNTSLGWRAISLSAGKYHLPVQEKVEGTSPS